MINLPLDLFWDTGSVGPRKQLADNDLGQGARVSVGNAAHQRHPFRPLFAVVQDFGREADRHGPAGHFRHANHWSNMAARVA